MEEWGLAEQERRNLSKKGKTKDGHAGSRLWKAWRVHGKSLDNWTMGVMDGS